MLLFDRLQKALENTGRKEQEKNLEDTPKGMKEEVIIGYNYTDDNSEDTTLGIGIPRKDPESPNNLDPDSGVYEDPKELDDEELEEDFNTEVTALTEFCEDPYSTPVSIEEKEESMDALNDLAEKTPIEDTSGNTSSWVASFLEKYAEGNDQIQILRMDLMKILSDMQWILESGNMHEQWALDFADALNEISGKI